MELLELDDINFFPCTCGYQVGIYSVIMPGEYSILYINAYIYIIRMETDNITSHVSAFNIAQYV